MPSNTMKSVLAGLVSALALSAIADAQVRQPYQADGAPLRPGQDCALQYVDRSLSGALFIKASPGQSGSYRLVVRRHNNANDVLIQMGGWFDGSATEEVVIARAFLTSRNLMEARRGQFVTQGRDVYLIDGALEIYDEDGRLTCSTPQLDVLRAPALPGASNGAGPVAEPRAQSQRRIVSPFGL